MTCTMKRIIIFSCVFPPEPVVSSQISQQLAIQLAANENQVCVFSPRPSRPANFDFSSSSLQEMPFEHVVAKSFVSPTSNLFTRLLESLSFGLSSFFFLIKRRNKVDVVYMNTWPIFSQFFVMLACLITNKPYVIHIQDIYPESLVTKVGSFFQKFITKPLLILDLLVLKKAKKIVVISPRMEKYLIDNRVRSADNIVIAYNWQTSEEYLPNKFNQSSQEFTFMYLGNIGPLANIPFVIKSFNSIKVDGIKLVIAGSGSSKSDCMRLVTELDEKRVFFLDVPAGEVFNIQSMADCLILPIQPGAGNFSIPSKLTAYMLSAKPILASVDMDTDTADAIINSGAGWVSIPNDSNDFIDMVKKILVISREKLEDIGMNGYRYCKSNFSRERNLSVIEKAILSAC